MFHEPPHQTTASLFLSERYPGEWMPVEMVRIVAVVHAQAHMVITTHAGSTSPRR